jgi:hypothetical protein
VFDGVDDYLEQTQAHTHAVRLVECGPRFPASAVSNLAKHFETIVEPEFEITLENEADDFTLDRTRARTSAYFLRLAMISLGTTGFTR